MSDRNNGKKTDDDPRLAPDNNASNRRDDDQVAGLDNSAFENVPSGEKADAAREPQNAPVPGE